MSSIVAEMDRSHSDLHFEAALAADEILGKEPVRLIAQRRSQRDNRRVLVAINGGFGSYAICEVTVVCWKTCIFRMAS